MKFVYFSVANQKGIHLFSCPTIKCDVIPSLFHVDIFSNLYIVFIFLYRHWTNREYKSEKEIVGQISTSSVKVAHKHK